MTLKKQSATNQNFLKGRIKLILVVAVLGAMMLNSVAILGSSDMREFVIDQYGLELVYPESWLAYKTPHGNHGDHEVIAFLSNRPPIFQNIVVAYKQFDANSISDVAYWGGTRILSRFIRYSSYSLVPYSSEHVSGLAREYTAFSGSPFGAKGDHCKDLYLLNGQRGYVLSFCASEGGWAKVSPLFDKIMADIRFVE